MGGQEGTAPSRAQPSDGRGWAQPVPEAGRAVPGKMAESQAWSRGCHLLCQSPRAMGGRHHRESRQLEVGGPKVPEQKPSSSGHAGVTEAKHPGQDQSALTSAQAPGPSPSRWGWHRQG